MSNYVFPRLPGLTFDYVMRPTFKTLTQTSADRRETSIAEDPYPLWEFDLTYEFLRDFHTGRAGEKMTELQRIVGFYLARRGSFDTFLLDLGELTANKKDADVAGVQIGVGDGVTTRFQLLRPIGEFLDEVQALKGDPTVFVNDVPQTTGWSVGTTGGIVFASAPAAGAVVAASFSWYYRVRFSEDTAEWSSFSYQFYENKLLKLRQVRL